MVTANTHAARTDKIMQIKILIRNAIQYILIRLFEYAKPTIESKIMSFSYFMAHNKNGGFLLKRGRISNCYFILHAKDVAVSRRIYIGLDDEYLKAKKAIEWISVLRSEGGVNFILDIGANIGHICIPLIKHGVIDQAAAYEPEPENYRLLKSNIILNGLDDSIVVHNHAIGSKPQEVLELELSNDNYGDHRIRVSEKEGLYCESQRSVLQVESKSLDSLGYDVESKNILLWIDVQGYEGAVLFGGVNMLQQRPAIGLEFWPYGLKRAGTFGHLLRSIRHYRCYYDLSSLEPRAQDIEKLCVLYHANFEDDVFMIDILVF